MAEAVTFHINEELVSALDELAARFDRPRDELVGEMLNEWLAYQRDFVRKVEEGIAAADRGEFATEEEVSRVLAKYGVTW